MRKFFKIISYSLLYLFISIASAYGVITVSMNNYTNSQSSNTGTVEEITIPEEISTMFGKITSAPALELNLDLNLATQEQNFSIFINGEIDLSNGFENLGVDATLSLEIGENSPININIVYQNEILFIELLDGKFYIQTNTILGSIDQILTLLDVEMPDLGFDLSSMDMNSIMALFASYEETINENGSKTLSVSIPVVNNIDLICSEDYTLNGFILPETSIEGIDLSANGELDYLEKANINQVDINKYNNLTEIIDIASGIISFAKQDEIGLNYNFDYNNLEIFGRIDIDILQKMGRLSINISDINANIIFMNNNLYLEIFNIYAKFNVNEIGILLSLIEKHFNASLPENLIGAFINVIENGDIGGLIENIQLPNIDISEIDLSILESIVKDGDKTTITIADVGVIDVTISNRVLTALGFTGFGVEANLTVSDCAEIFLLSQEESYINLALLLPTLDNVLAILHNNTFTGNINVQFGDFDVDIAYTAHFGKNQFITLSTTLFGQNIVANIINNKVYIDISETKIVCDLNNIDTIIEKITNKFFPETDKENTNDITMQLTEFLKDMIDRELNPILITSFVESENGLSIVILNKFNISLANATNELKLTANYEDITLSANIIGSEQEIVTPTLNEKEYTSLEDIVDIAINVYDYVLSENFYLSFNASYQDINVIGALNYDNNGFSVSATLNYQALTANVILYENKIYITAENIKLVFNLNDFDYVKAFLNDYFGVDVDGLINKLLGKEANSADTTLDLENFDIKQILALFGDVDIESIISDLTLKLTSENITLSLLDGLNINVGLVDKMISSLNIQYPIVNGEQQHEISASITIEKAPLVFNPVGEYTDVGSLLNYVELLLDYVNTKKLEFEVNINFNDNIITGNLQVDFTSNLMLSASLTSSTIENFNVNLNIEKDATTGKQMLYFDYNGLCLKIDNSNFNEILYVVLEVLGVDTSMIPFLSDIDLDLDFSQIDTDIASMEFSVDDIVNILKMVKSLKEENNSITITLAGASMYNNDKAEDLTIILSKDNGKISTLKLSNCYLNNELTTTLGASITFKELGEFIKVDQSKNYVDISGANELIKALVNMSNGVDFHVSGSFNVDLLGATIVDPIPIDIYIHVLEKGKIELYAKIGKIPAIPAVNTPSFFTSVSDRYLNIYYRDGYVYLHRTEKHWGSPVEYMTKVSLGTILNDPFHYVQYCFGFTDTIMDAIIESMDNPRTEPMDMGNILTGFTVTNGTNYNIVLNMEELSNNPDLDTLTVDLITMKDSQDKSYIGSFGFYLHMPLADIFNITLYTSENLQFIDYGSTVDMTPLYDFLDKFKSEYNFPAETEWQYEDGEWGQSSEILYNITFNTNCEQVVESQSYHYGDELSLPILNNYVVDNGVTKVEYTFAGWYENETFAENSQFTSSTMPRGDVVLYAKWITNTQNYRTITFVTNSEQTVNSITKLEGEAIELPMLSEKVETIGNTTSYYNFAGWYSEASFSEESLFTSNTMPSYSPTLYAKWELYKSETTSNLTIYDNNEIIFTGRVKVGSKLDFSNIENINDNTEFYLDKYYQNKYTGDFIATIEDLKLHIRNQYDITVVSEYGDSEIFTSAGWNTIDGKNYTKTIWQGEKLPELTSYTYDDGTQTEEITYTYNGYSDGYVVEKTCH